MWHALRTPITSFWKYATDTFPYGFANCKLFLKRIIHLDSLFDLVIREINRTPFSLKIKQPQGLGIRINIHIFPYLEQ